VNIQFRGGFAWLFTPEGQVYVCLVDKPGSQYRHRMVLEVLSADVDSATSQVPVRTHREWSYYALSGDVALAVDGASLPSGKVAKSFADVYSISAISQLPQPKIAADWRDRTSVRLLLSSGAVASLPGNAQPCKFVDGNGKDLGRRVMATQASYSAAVVPTRSVDLTSSEGRVVLRWRANISLVMLAECDCASTNPPVGAPVPGFDDVFYLYTGLGKECVVQALVDTFLASPSKMAKDASMQEGPGFITPGPDCLKHEHQL
jgi:hypothetical protein